MDVQKSMVNGFQVMEKNVEQFLDMCLFALDSYSDRQDQIKDVIQNYVNHKKSEQEGAVKIYENLLLQTKKNQQQYQQFMKEAASSMMENASKFVPNLGFQVTK